jgi:hypothetical protein
VAYCLSDCICYQKVGGAISHNRTCTCLSINFPPNGDKLCRSMTWKVSAKQHEAIKRHNPNHLRSKLLPLKSGKIQAVFEHKTTNSLYFLLYFFCCSSFLSFWTVSEVIGYDLQSGFDSMHRYKFKLLIRTTERKILKKTAQVSSTSPPLSIIITPV